VVQSVCATCLVPCLLQDIARQLIRAALRRAAEKREVRYQDLLRMSSGQRREYHDDITVRGARPCSEWGSKAG